MVWSTSDDNRRFSTATRRVRRTRWIPSTVRRTGTRRLSSSLCRATNRRHHRRNRELDTHIRHEYAVQYWVTGLFTGLLTFLYFLAFETTQGWTPGKKLLGLSVRGPGGAAKPSAQQSAIRNSWTLLPIIPFIGGLLGFIAIIVIAVTINGSQTKQGKHDELAGGTQVVKG
jgi:RDD family